MSSRIKTLSKYIVSSIGGLLFAFIYNVIDGIFVGRAVGAEGLGAVNLAVPFITFAIALSAMPGMGGGTIVAISLGEGDWERANKAFHNSFFLTVFMAAVIMCIGMTLPHQIVRISGGRNVSETMNDLSVTYLFWFSAFFAFELLSSCLAVFVRNDGAPVHAFVGMCAGAVANIFLDWLFLFPLDLGIAGAGLASGLGQIISFVILLTHFLRGKGNLKFRKFRIELKVLGNICKRGLPEAASQLTTPVTALCFNIVLARYIGDIGVSTFSVLSYIFSLVNAVLCGVSQGLQPLWGQNYGEGNVKEIKRCFNSGMAINLVLSAVIFAVTFFAARPILHIFSTDEELIASGSEALPLFAFSFVPMAVNLIFTAYFYSTKRTARANVVALSRGVVVKAVVIFCMPLIFDIKYIWLAPLAAESVTLIISVILYATRKDDLPKPELMKN